MSDRASSLQQAMDLHRAGRVQDAARVYGAMLAANPHDADAAHLLGVALGQLGQPAEACSLIRIALQRYPHDPLAHLNLGNALAAMGDAAPALASYERAAQLRPDFGDAHWACARLQRQLGRHAETLASLDRLLALQPRRADAWTERGGVLLDLDRPEEALPDLERALALDARQTAARALRGSALRALGRCSEALRELDALLAVDPRDVIARFTKAHLLLLHGDLPDGWPMYETRFELDALNGLPQRWPRPRWTGREPLAGRSILLWAERGLGDTLQFVRYVPMVCALGARVTLQVQPALKTLLVPQFRGVEVIAEGEEAELPELHSPLLSLPGAFGTTLATIPAHSPYLALPAAAVAAWRRRLPGVGVRHIGIAWQGNPTAEKNWARGRSIPLEHFAALAELPGVQLTSLQTGPFAADLGRVRFGHRIASFGEDAVPFAAAAALIAALDLVICSDTSIAHLAGALGRPVWLALHTSSEWRWMLDREDSPWYPSMRLFRQRTRGEWSDVMRQIAAALDGLPPPGPGRCQA